MANIRVLLHPFSILKKGAGLEVQGIFGWDCSFGNLHWDKALVSCSSVHGSIENSWSL